MGLSTTIKELLERDELIMGRILLLCFGLLMCCQLRAFELGASLGSQTEYTDNATFSNDGKRSELEQLVSLDFSVVETRRDFELDAQVNLESRSFLHNVYDDETSISTGFGILNFNIVESFLTWETSYTRNEELKDPFGAEVDDNTDRQEVFETGPSVYYAISATEQAYVTSRYIHTENSDPDVSDTGRSSTQVGYSWEMDSLTSSNISFGYESIIKPDGGADYDRRDVNLGVTREIAGGGVALTTGLSILKDEAGQEERSNTYSLTLRKEGVLGHYLYVSYDESISDTSLGFQATEFAGAGEEGALPSGSAPPQQVLVDDPPQGNSIVRRTAFGAEISRDLSTLGYSLSFSWVHERAIEIYDTSYEKGVAFEIGSQIAPNARLSFEIEYETNSSKTNAVLNRDRSLSQSVNVNYRLTERFSANGALGYEAQKDGSDQRTDQLTVSVGVLWSIL